MGKFMRLPGRLLLENPHLPELLEPLVQQRRPFQLLHVLERALEVRREQLGCRGRVGVRAAVGLGDDLVDDAELVEIARR